MTSTGYASNCHSPYTPNTGGGTGGVPPSTTTLDLETGSGKFPPTYLPPIYSPPPTYLPPTYPPSPYSPPVYPNASQNTMDYSNLINSADLNQDGLTQQELQGQIRSYEQQVDLLNQMKNYMYQFNPAGASFLEPWSQQLQQKLASANRLNERFNVVDGIGGFADGKVTQPDLWIAAGQDGNSYDLSSFDLKEHLPPGLPPTPIPTPTPTPSPIPGQLPGLGSATETHLGVQRDADKNRDGLSLNEVNHQLFLYKEQLRQLEAKAAQTTTYPDSPSAIAIKARRVALQEKIIAAENLSRHFFTFDGVNGNNYDQRISFDEIIAVAQRDGNVNNVSQQDLGLIGLY